MPASKRHRAHVRLLKNWKRIATRCDRLAVNYLAAIVLAATVTQWLG
jgi:transposase